jgi:hypothetical protein
MSTEVLWQHVVCVIGAMQRAAQRPLHILQPETHAATTLQYS